MAANGPGSLPLPPRNVASPGPLSPPSPGLAGRGPNPLTSKVTNVLSTSYADSEFRESLGLLDERAIGNSPETRRQLRLNIQKEVIESNGEIITEFGRVAEQLRRIGTTIDRLNRNYLEMKSHVTAAHDATASTLEEASSLMTQRRNVETKQQLLHAFREHFVLSEDEVACLTMTSEPIDDQFFLVLAKAKRIRKDCEVLLGFENQTLGLEVMDQTSKNLNQAFQKLYRWVQKEFKTLNLENPQINSSVRRALRVLAERPSLFQSCLDFFAEAREETLSDSFFVALTGMSASGARDDSMKPIMLAAHDPLRYVGDMLAWAHSATVSEREALEVLFVSDGNDIARGMQEGRENELWGLISEEGEVPEEFDAVKALNDLVDRDVSGAARILRQRVEQVIQTNEDTILAYKLANLLGFYRFTFSRLLGGDALLLQSMGSLEAEALRQFRALMRDHIATVQSERQRAPADLGPPDFLQDALAQLAAIMQTYETSLASAAAGAGGAADRASDFEPVLAEALDPFLRGCDAMAADLGPPGGLARAVFLANCLQAARAALLPFDFAAPRAARLQAAVADHAAAIADAQHAYLRSGSGLAPLLDAAAAAAEASTSPDAATAAAAAATEEEEALRPEALAHAARALDDFLPSAVMDAMENVRQLRDARLAREATDAAADRFCADFERVEEMLAAADEEREKNGGGGQEEETSLRALFPRTTGEIRVLLS
ncbi:oligomeric complex COG6 [Xylariaceae sp. FL0804]|nr:oligomeric complex COG6 [Xylariaceae sp. FL0804]